MTITTPREALEAAAKVCRRAAVWRSTNSPFGNGYHQAMLDAECIISAIPVAGKANPND